MKEITLKYCKEFCKNHIEIRLDDYGAMVSVKCKIAKEPVKVKSFFASSNGNGTVECPDKTKGVGTRRPPWINACGIDENGNNVYKTPVGMNFGYALEQVKDGNGMRLPQWGPDVIIRAQYPDKDSKMTAPYLYVESRFGKVPWKETMIELFSDEWEVVE